MAITLIIILIIAIVIAFSVQNAAPVAFSFLFWQTQASLAIIIFLAVAAGAVLGVAAMSSWVIRRKLQSKKQKKDEARSGGTDTRNGSSSTPHNS